MSITGRDKFTTIIRAKKPICQTMHSIAAITQQRSTSTLLPLGCTLVVVEQCVGGRSTDDCKATRPTGRPGSDQTGSIEDRTTCRETLMISADRPTDAVLIWPPAPTGPARPGPRCDAIQEVDVSTSERSLVAINGLVATNPSVPLRASSPLPPTDLFFHQPLLPFTAWPRHSRSSYNGPRMVGWLAWRNDWMIRRTRASQTRLDSCQCCSPEIFAWRTSHSGRRRWLLRMLWKRLFVETNLATNGNGAWRYALQLP